MRRVWCHVASLETWNPSNPDCPSPGRYPLRSGVEDGGDGGGGDVDDGVALYFDDHSDDVDIHSAHEHVANALHYHSAPFESGGGGDEGAEPAADVDDKDPDRFDMIHHCYYYYCSRRDVVAVGMDRRSRSGLASNPHTTLLCS